MNKKLVIFGLSIIILLLACSSDKKKPIKKSTDSLTSTKKTTTKPKGMSPEKLWKINCVICHGINGKLGVNGAKDLSLSKMNLDQRIEIITNGKNTMTAFHRTLKPDQIKALAEFTMDNFKSE